MKIIFSLLESDAAFSPFNAAYEALADKSTISQDKLAQVFFLLSLLPLPFPTLHSNYALSALSASSPRRPCSKSDSASRADRW